MWQMSLKPFSHNWAWRRPHLCFNQPLQQIKSTVCRNVDARILLLEMVNFNSEQVIALDIWLKVQNTAPSC